MNTFDQYVAEANRIMASCSMPEEPRGLFEPVRYALAEGGKRLRPVLTMAMADAVAAPGARVDASKQAEAIEMFHNFTLLHDDVMDRADVRRGKPAVWKRWNESTAILSGDAMLTLATQKVMANFDSTCDAVEALRLFNRTAMEIYAGQQLDMDFEQRSDVTSAEYMEMIRLKTSVLLGCACEMGLIVGGASLEKRRAGYAYGEALGLAFQLRDDWLDTFGDPATFGKEIGGDIMNGKKTWLLINALAADTSGRLAGIMADSAMPRTDKLEAVRAIYRSTGVSDACLALIEKYAVEAVEKISGSGLPGAAVEFFAGLARQTVTRLK